MPVGEGHGLLPIISWGSGMVIFSEGRGGFFFGVVIDTSGGGGAAASSINDWN